MQLESLPPQSQIEPPVTEAPVQDDAAMDSMTDAGATPDVLDPVASPLSTSDQAFDLNSGLHYADDYRAECLRTGNENHWHEQYSQGYTSAQQFQQPFDGNQSFQFNLQKGFSASEALKQWMNGLTITDYRAAGVAAEMDEVRDDMGDQKFDSLFGSNDAMVDSMIPVDQRLSIDSADYTIPIDDQMRELGRIQDQAAASPMEEAEWQEYERDPDRDKAADEIVEMTEKKEDERDRTLA